MPRLSVRRRWRLTVVVRAAHACGGVLIQLGLEPIENPIDTLGYCSGSSKTRQKEKITRANALAFEAHAHVCHQGIPPTMAANRNRIISLQISAIAPKASWACRSSYPCYSRAVSSPNRRSS
jgi:hypothetical protein